MLSTSPHSASEMIIEATTVTSNIIGLARYSDVTCSANACLAISDLMLVVIDSNRPGSAEVEPVGEGEGVDVLRGEVVIVLGYRGLLSIPAGA